MNSPLPFSMACRAAKKTPALPLLLRCARQRAVRGDHAAAGVLSNADGDRDPEGACGRDAPKAYLTAACWSSSARARASRRRSCWESCRSSAPTSAIDVSNSAARRTRRLAAATFPPSTCGPSSATSPTRSPLPAGLARLQQDRLLPGLDDRQSHAGRSGAPAARLPGGAVARRPADRRRRSQEGRCARSCSAYNDAAGVTAAFNLNLLARINRELAGTFDLAAFRHDAIYNRARRAASRCTWRA